MTQLFTANDVLLYLYKETPDKETQELDRLLMVDADFSALYQEMSVAKELIEQVSLEPSDSSIERILAYSRSFLSA